MKNRKFINCMLLMISLTMLFILSESASASSVTVLKGIDAIKDTSNNMVYYKSGVVSNSTGTVNLIKKNKKTGVKTIVTKVDENPFYLQDNYIYYTTNNVIYRIKTDGTNKKQLGSQVKKTIRFKLLGLNGNYIYYSDIIYGDNNRLVIGRIHVNGTSNNIIREVNNYYNYTGPILANNKIYYVTRTSDNKLSLTSTTLGGKTTKTVIKTGTKISDLHESKNGLYFIYQKEDNTDYIIRRIDSSGVITNLRTIESDSYLNINLSCYEVDFIYYNVNSKIYQMTYDGKNHQLLYDTININKSTEYISELYIKGNWMIIQMDNESYFPTYCVKKDGSYPISLGGQCYSNSFDILSDTIYYRVVTIPGDDESYTFNDENIYRKITLPLKEYE